MAPNNEQQPHYDTHRYAGDQAADTRRVMNHMPDEDRSTTQEIRESINASQSAELAPEVRMGEDRAIGDTPNWDAFDSEQLYNFATQNNAPSTADNLGRAFNEGGNSLAEAANALYEAVHALDGAWTGVAADSAKTALSPLAQAAGGAGQTAQMMGVQMSQQSLAATEVRKLPPAQKHDNQQSLNAMIAGGPAAMQADIKAQKDAADAVKREQISYLNAYTKTMSAVDAQTPSFVPPKERIGGGGVGGGSLPGGSVVIPGTGNQQVYNGGTTTGAPTGKYTGVAGPGDAASGHGYLGDPNQTDQSGYAPLPSGLGTGTSGYNPGPTNPSPTFGPGGGPGGVPSTSVPGAGAGGFGGGFGSFGGPGGAGGAGGAGAGAGSGNPGATGPKGMTPAGMAPGGRGGAGGGMGGAPRGKGDGEEDQEHERPAYLVEGDPESAFGNDQLTAPAVIGGDDE
ncbi:hypothetical protein [Actinophytocola algeriensis]|uniref:PPE family protein n=1 Tax=Actinophytocola algeriensis TaxID=1768010 RepID=A0A7W7VEF7_9PSEU|nr:hypothetical protein [Actinophytocola algeriensis]MBB4907213.1 hypothetical protein [Actinophytocola algeriensis]MBE1478696.1 hypothetical protein [Actinophytocola algeriensis]